MFIFFVSAAGVIALFVLLGIISSRRVRSESDYAVAGRSASTSGVSGIFLGALAGGATTVGTVQMAYQNGLSAWWFTFGGGIGCLILGIWLARPLRRSGLVTIPQFLERLYGRPVSLTSMLSTSLGTYISVVAQFLAGIALFRTILPLSTSQASLLFAVLVLAFIYLGGLKSYSAIGKAKTLLLYVAMLSCVAVAWTGGHSPAVLLRSLPATPFFDPFFGGLGKNLGAFTSIIVGIVCTQIFIQGVFAASDEETARKGVLVTSLVLPTMGFLGVLIGLSLRHSGVVLEASHALPFFIKSNFPAVIGGVFWGGILIAIVGTAAGLSLGIATNVINDLYIGMAGKSTVRDGARLLLASRLSVVLIVLSAAFIAVLSDGSMILQWSFLSMGLRGTGTFFPFVIAILWPKALSPRWGFASSMGGLVVMVLWKLVSSSIPPLFAGLAVSGGLALLGILFDGRRIRRRTR